MQSINQPISQSIIQLNVEIEVPQKIDAIVESLSRKIIKFKPGWSKTDGTVES
jgi:hypothetical protein